jgi:hypothetical protein
MEIDADSFPITLVDVDDDLCSGTPGIVRSFTSLQRLEYSTIFS